jgi:hypothetical protein
MQIKQETMLNIKECQHRLNEANSKVDDLTAKLILLQDDFAALTTKVNVKSDLLSQTVA